MEAIKGAVSASSWLILVHIGPHKEKEKGTGKKTRRTSTARTESRPQRCIPSSTTGWSPSSTSIASRSGMKSGPSTSSCRYPPVSLACAHVGRNLNERTIGKAPPDFLGYYSNSTRAWSNTNKQRRVICASTGKSSGAECGLEAGLGLRGWHLSRDTTSGSSTSLQDI